MRKSKPPYPPEFRRQMIELVRSGRTPEDLDEGRRDDGLTTAERDELRRLRRENRTLQWVDINYRTKMLEIAADGS